MQKYSIRTLYVLVCIDMCNLQVKNKWMNIKSEALQHAREAKQPPTGGGPKKIPEWFHSHVIDIVGTDSPTIRSVLNDGEFSCFQLSLIKSLCIAG